MWALSYCKPLLLLTIVLVRKWGTESPPIQSTHRDSIQYSCTPCYQNNLKYVLTKRNMFIRLSGNSIYMFCQVILMYPNMPSSECLMRMKNDADTCIWIQYNVRLYIMYIYSRCRIIPTSRILIYI